MVENFSGQSLTVISVLPGKILLLTSIVNSAVAIKMDCRAVPPLHALYNPCYELNFMFMNNFILLGVGSYHRNLILLKLYGV